MKKGHWQILTSRLPPHHAKFKIRGSLVAASSIRCGNKPEASLQGVPLVLLMHALVNTVFYVCAQSLSATAFIVTYLGFVY